MSHWHARAIFHFILPCTDVDQSTAFYGHFGFVVKKDNRDVLWPDYVGANFNMMPGAQGRAVQLVLPDAHELQTRIDLIQWVRPHWHNENTARPLEERIPRVMALLTHNVRDAYEDLVSRGLQPTQPLRAPDPVTGVQGVVCFTDPDGHIVELIEYFPGQLGSRTDQLPSRT